MKIRAETRTGRHADKHKLGWTFKGNATNTPTVQHPLCLIKKYPYIFRVCCEQSVVYYLESFVLVYFQFVHQFQDLLVEIERCCVWSGCGVWPGRWQWHGCVGRQWHRCVGRLWHRRIGIHPFVKFHLSNTVAFQWIDHQDPSDKTLALCRKTFSIHDN